ncbi:hypothetical protein ACTMTI_27030 [Nonomuraea sp. H19]|uniref:hypothetical protein n=1 Tax=Nonomuraea sp. H19 TaxID=3452206 RepID=UPI003F8BA63F
MTAVVVSLVAVVLLVLVVVALGMRSMNRRESSLPPERLKEMAEKEEMTHCRSTDEFAAHEPRMRNFSPDFSPIDEPKPPKPVRTGQRGRRGVDEWGNPSSDDEDEEFWANIRSDAEQGNFGAGGTVAARKAAARPDDRERPAERPAERPTERPSQRRRARPQPVAAASVDPEATTIQAPLPQRQVPAAAAAANLADLVEPAKRATPAQAELADQRTMTFAAPTPTSDVMSILGVGAPAPTPRPASDSMPSSRSYSPSANGSGSFPASPAGGSGSFPAANGSGSFPASPVNGSGSFPAAGPNSSGSFPVAQPTPIHGAPTSDPFPAYTGNGADPLETTWTNPPASTTSGSWSASPDILDDPTPATAYGGPATSWPAFEEPARPSYPASYEVRAGWAVADDSDPLTGPSPATGTPTVPGRAVSAYDDVLSTPTSTPTPASPPGSIAYETGDITTAAAPWPEPPSGGSWPAFGDNNRQGGQSQPAQGGRRRAPEQDYPHDYYR